MSRVELKIRIDESKTEIVSIQTIGVPIYLSYVDQEGELIETNDIHCFEGDMTIKIKDGNIVFDRTKHE